MKKIFTILFLFLGLQVSGQINPLGTPLVQNYAPEETPGSQQNWCIAQDRQGVLYVGNNDAGVLIFDGENWSSVAVSNQSRIYNIAASEEGTVYVGAVNEFGYLAPGNDGRIQYHSLSLNLDSINLGTQNIYDILFINDEVWFCAKSFLYRYAPMEDTVRTVSHKVSGSEYGFHTFHIGDKVYRGDHLLGLMVQESDTSYIAPGGGFFSRKAIMFGVPFDENRILMGVFNGGLHLYHTETGTVEAFTEPRYQKMFSGQYPAYHAAQVDDDLFAVGTLEGGGVYVFNRAGDLVYHLNRSHGLRDNFVTYVHADTLGGAYGSMWLALTDGLARVDLHLPFNLFGETSGFQSYILSINEYQGKLFLGTGSGVYVETQNEAGEMAFRKLEDIGISANKFLYFKPPGEKGKFLAGTNEGVYEIHANGRVTSLEENVINIEYAGKQYYILDMIASRKFPGRLYIGQAGSLIVLEYLGKGRFENLEEINEKLRLQITNLAEDKHGDLWVSSALEGVYRIRFSEPGWKIDTFGLEQGLPNIVRNFVYNIGNELIVQTQEGTRVFDYEEGMFVPDVRYGKRLTNGSLATMRMMQDRDSSLWIGVKKEGYGDFEVLLPDLGTEKLLHIPFRRLPRKSTDVFFQDREGIVWMGKSNQLFSVRKEELLEYQPKPYGAMITRVTFGEDSVSFDGRFFETLESGRTVFSPEQPEKLVPSIPFKLRNVTFSFSSVFYQNSDKTEYSYMLEGFDREWSDWEQVRYKDYTNIPYGKYTFKVRARNVYTEESTTAIYRFMIQKPWYHTIVAYIGYLILGFIIFISIIKIYTRRLKNENLRLEGIVAERTAEVVRQKDELEDSIHYASRIQRALLPSEKNFGQAFSESFILFRPRDIVSGDFYWVSQIEDKVYVCAADCTGHGVPGAFMSLLGISFLNEIVNSNRREYPDEILNDLRDHVIHSLKQTGEVEGETKDGMDLALSVFDFSSRKIYFSGAYNPLYRLRPLTAQEKAEGEGLEVPRRDLTDGYFYLEQVPANRMPIGISSYLGQPFDRREIPMVPGERYYMFSDGYVDQFGGARGKKLLVKNFKRLILTIQEHSMEEQHRRLSDYLDKWMGEKYEQIDDIIVVGIEIPA